MAGGFTGCPRHFRDRLAPGGSPARASGVTDHRRDGNLLRQRRVSEYLSRAAGGIGVPVEWLRSFHSLIFH